MASPASFTYEYNTTHSLASEPWFPAEALKGGQVVPLMSGARRQKVRQETKENLKVSEEYWDYDELCYSDDEDLEDMVGKMTKLMQEQWDMNLMNSRREAGEAIVNHVLSYFKSTRTEERSNQTYDIEIRVRYLRPLVWRLLRVPASMPLHALADRVLIPAMQYARGYHSYAYRLPTSAYKDRLRPEDNKELSFIFTRAHTIDTMHLRNRRGGYACVNTEDVLVSDVLRAEGDRIYWVYDLGDYLDHELVLKKVHPQPMPDEQGRTTILLDGANCGVPEDPVAVCRHAKRIEKLKRYPPSTHKYHKALHEIQGSCTYKLLRQPDPRRFDPTFFSKSLTQKSIDKAMTGEPANYGGALAGGGGFSFNFATGKQRSRVQGGPASAAPGNVLCGSCEAVLSTPKWCGACRNVAYCDRTCQSRDWKTHKLACFKTPAK
ncbi:hypothetical protein QOT17_007327 [Balamuthia mandrillaris]